MGAGAAGGRWHAVDHVKAAAIVAVVFTHAGRVSLDAWGSVPDFLLTSLWTRFHVPAFLLVSGFLYARRQPVPVAEVGRRLSRIGLPYLLASLVAIAVGIAVGAAGWLRWPTPVHGVSDLVWQLSTASALGVYYYVLLAAACLLVLWPLSLTGRAGAWLLLLACAALTLAIDVGVVARPSLWLAKRFGGDVFFWATRNPLEGFHLGYFAAGWVAALHVSDLARAADARSRALLALCAAGIALGWLSFSGVLPIRGSFGRVAYTLAVVGATALHPRRRRAGPTLRFLGDATLGLYLYHRIFQLLAQPVTDGWPAVPRIGAQVTVGLAGASLVAWGGRRLLGAAPARRLLGA